MRDALIFVSVIAVLALIVGWSWHYIQTEALKRKGIATELVLLRAQVSVLTNAVRQWSSRG